MAPTLLPLAQLLAMVHLGDVALETGQTDKCLTAGLTTEADLVENVLHKVEIDMNDFHRGVFASFLEIFFWFLCREAGDSFRRF